jgi:acetyl esterase/lipase
LPTVTSKPSAAIEVKPGSTYKDVTYCTAGGDALKMDVYFPQEISAKPMPAAVFIHGGSWMQGDKNTGLIDHLELLARGYFVASLDYRLAPQHTWPAQIEDVKCAIRHLRASAATYRIDPTRIGVWGHSAGGHLAAMVGTTDAGAGFDVGGYLDQSSRVRAVVDMSGAADLPKFFLPGDQQIMQTVFGVTSLDDPILIRASPVTYISKDDPPFLILHGDMDEHLPPSQSQILHDRLQTAGVQSTFVIVKNATHALSPAGTSMTPTRAEITKMIADFFDEHLR